MVKITVLISIIMTAASLSLAGDVYKGYLPFVGKWQASQCKDGPMPEKFSISTPGTRKNSLNIYRLNSQGKKTQFILSTMPQLQSQTLWKLTAHASKDGEIDFTGTDGKSSLNLKITVKDSKTIETSLSRNNETQLCSYKKL